MNKKLLQLVVVGALTTAFAVGCASTQKMSDGSTGGGAMATGGGAGGSRIVYEVLRGDSLWKIAGKSTVYGNPYQWPLIYKDNASKIKDPDLIYPGQRFDINLSASSGEVQAAIRHAKTRGAWSMGESESSDKAYLGR